jgi:3-hydroxybutyryl-CoA dehydrogenase
VIRTVAVIGAGTMGHGIAQVAAQAGLIVRLTDAVPGAAERGLARIAANLGGAVERGKLTADARGEVLLRITAVETVEEAAEGADCAIEAVPEQLEQKAEVFRTLDSRIPAPGLLATNTSSLSIAKIASASRTPERILGLHFFNPVHVMKLVEIVTHPRTSSAATAEAVDLAKAMGKDPIVVKDSPGFASSRLGITIGLEAMRMLEEGVASAEDIDKAMALGYGHPMGPLKLTDLVGLDVRLAIAEYLHSQLGGAHYAPPAILKRLVSEGKLGKKSGEGFYKW